MQFLALWITTLPEPAEPAWLPLAGANAKLEFALLAPGRPFVVCAFRMDPGCILPAHCHPGGGGITLCTAGAVLMRHDDLLEGSAPFSATGQAAQVEAVSLALLREQQFTLFTPTRSNVHQFEAGPAGATGIEIAVQWQGGGAFSFLRWLDATAASSGIVGKRLRGTWVGMDIARAQP